MTFDLFDIIHSVIFFQLSILIFVLLQKGWNSVSNRLLAFFLFVQMMASLNAIWWNHYSISAGYFLWFCHLTDPFFLTWGPTIFLYIFVQNNPGFRFTFKYMLHYVPAIIMAIYLMIVFVFLPEPLKIEQIKSPGSKMFIFSILDKIVIVQVGVYNIAAILYQEQILKKHRLRSKNSEEKIRWNRFIIYGYFLTCVLYDSLFLFSPSTISREVFKHIVFILFMLYFSAILYKAIVSTVFAGHEDMQVKRNLLLPGEELEGIAQQAEKIMLAEKPFLNFSYGLKELAARVNVSERLLSQAINECRDKNINDFINYYRIEEAKRIILETGNRKKTSLEIAFDSGFNSKSAFYLVFKKYTGLTPSEYRSINLHS